MKTEIIAILDASGSMQRLTDDTIGGFNGFLEAQRNVSGEARVTVVTFDTRVRVIYKGQDVATAPKLNRNTYLIGGMTALNDAIGQTFNGEGARIKQEAWADNVVVCIITDGMENSSVEFTQEQAKAVVEHAERHGWVVTFLAANIDAAQTATSLGIRGQNVASYSPTSLGTASSYAAFASNTANVRMRGPAASDLLSTKVTMDMALGATPDAQDLERLKAQKAADPTTPTP